MDMVVGYMMDVACTYDQKPPTTASIPRAAGPNTDNTDTLVAVAPLKADALPEEVHTLPTHVSCPAQSLVLVQAKRVVESQS